VGFQAHVKYVNQNSALALVALQPIPIATLIPKLV